MDARVGPSAGEAIRGEEVIEAPADVLSAGIHAISPPGISACESGIGCAEGIGEALVAEESREGVTLLVGEACVAAVGAGVGEVYLLVGAVEVAADEDGFKLGKLGEVTAEIFVPLQPVIEAGELALGIRDVGGYNEEVLELGGKDAALGGVVAGEIGVDADGGLRGREWQCRSSLFCRPHARPRAQNRDGCHAPWRSHTSSPAGKECPVGYPQGKRLSPCRERIGRR